MGCSELNVGNRFTEVANSAMNIETFINQIPERFLQKMKSDLTYIETCKIPTLNKIILFGSVATGKIKKNSDIDLLIVTDVLITDRMIKAGIRDELSESIDGVTTDVVFYVVDSYKNSTDLFTKQIREHGIILWEEGDYSEIGKQLLCNSI
jgi:predicted nucleotidyltransferase